MSEKRLTREHIDKYKNLLETFANLKSLVQEKKKLEKQNDHRNKLKIRTLNGEIEAEKKSLIGLLSDDDKDYFIMVFFWDEAKKKRITDDFFHELGRTDLTLKTLTEFEEYLFDIDILEKAYKEQGIKGDLLTNVKMTNAWNEKRKRRKLKELMLPNEGGRRRTRRKLRAKSRKRSKSRKRRRKRRRSKSRKRYRKKRTKRRR